MDPQPYKNCALVLWSPDRAAVPFARTLPLHPFPGPSGFVHLQGLFHLQLVGLDITAVKAFRVGPELKGLGFLHFRHNTEEGGIPHRGKQPMSLAPKCSRACRPICYRDSQPRQLEVCERECPFNFSVFLHQPQQGQKLPEEYVPLPPSPGCRHPAASPAFTQRAPDTICQQFLAP